MDDDDDADDVDDADADDADDNVASETEEYSSGCAV